MPSIYSPPKCVGIKAIELYFPKCYIDQREFAKFNNQDEKKYLNALGLKEMAFCDDNEDVCTLALTVTSALLKNYNIDQNSIGMLVVGTESLIDKSKSVKTTLMPLFGKNTQIEGVDCKNACYGGTQALFHAVDWIYSRYEIEGKNAIVIMSDIAVYEPDSLAECTGGAGAVALLVGPDAPVVLEKSMISTYMSDNFDFYKPVCGTSCEFPRVDGKDSVECYLGAVEKCYEEYKRRSKLYLNKESTVQDFYATLFHCPYFQLAKKAFAQIYKMDSNAGMVNGHANHSPVPNGSADGDQKYYWVQKSNDLMLEKVAPFVDFNQRIGNMYTASLYASVVAVFTCSTCDMNGQRVLLFSYGSGLASSMFSLRFELTTIDQQNELDKMRKVCIQSKQRLDQRDCKSPLDYKNAIRRRIEQIQTVGEYKPSAKTDVLFPNTYYIEEIDEACRRKYDLFSA
ncbi:hypothetical protein M3Y97_00076400 [Aphelenchoides bicaudatus]|nr:hypothetical protein M3Y97_00076400 [Aphelenchoides bicaudatus]